MSPFMTMAHLFFLRP